MRSFILLPLLAFVPDLPAREKQISWSPRITTATAEGVELQRVYFSDGQTRYALSLDTESQVEEIPGGARFAYRKVPSATFTIRAAESKLPLPPQPKEIETYRRAALAFAPEASGAFADLKEEIDSLSLNGWRSYRLSFTYASYGRRYARSITFLTLENGQQAVLDVKALAAEFAEAVARSDYLIKSWHLLPVRPEAPRGS